jgi:hypothetical protein
MLRLALLISVLGFVVSVARADSFDMTQMTLSFEQFSGETLLPRFGVGLYGPNASLGFGGTIQCNGCELPVQVFTPGTRFSPGSLSLNADGNWAGELGGLVFDQENTGGGGFDLEITTFGSFVFPQPSGQPFTSCVPAANTQSSLLLFGRATNGTFVQNIVVSLPTNTGKYCTTWFFGPGIGGTGWYVNSGTFTATVVPEPGTLTLAASGLLTLALIKFRGLRRES